MQVKVLAMAVLPLLAMADKREMDKSDLFVAKCRDHCVKQLTVDGAEETCLVQEECLRCWASCKAFQNEHYIRDYCKRNKACTLGCRQACSFYLTSDRSMSSVFRSWGTTAEADPPVTAESDPQVVSLDLTSDVTGDSPVYSLVDGKAAVWNEDDVRMNGGNANVSEADQTRWTLLLEEMAFGQPLVSATVSWHSRGQGSQYLVTWELMSGGLRGHLVSADTSAALPLWPDEDYVVQVFTGSTASEPLQLSTRRPAPSPEEAAVPVAAAPVRMAAVLVILFSTVITAGALAVCRHRRRADDDAALLPDADDVESVVVDDDGRRSLLSRSLQNLPAHVLADPRTAPVFVVPCHKR